MLLIHRNRESELSVGDGPCKITYFEEWKYSKLTYFEECDGFLCGEVRRAVFLCIDT